MIRLSYNISDEDENLVFLCHEPSSGEHIVELTEEEYDEIVQDPPVPLKLSDGKIIVDTVRLRIAEIYQELESTNWVVNEIMEYMINEQEVPQELLDIRNTRNSLKDELAELEDN